MSSVHERWSELVAKGPRVRCTLTGMYFHKTETISDWKGGRWAKDYARKRYGENP